MTLVKLQTVIHCTSCYLSCSLRMCDPNEAVWTHHGYEQWSGVEAKTQAQPPALRAVLPIRRLQADST